MINIFKISFKMPPQFEWQLQYRKLLLIITLMAPAYQRFLSKDRLERCTKGLPQNAH